MTRRTRTRLRLAGLLSATWAYCAVCHDGTKDDFQETLLIRPLADGKVLSRFEFTMTASDESWLGQRTSETISSYHTTLIPRSLAAIVRTYEAEEVHLSLASGRWDYDRWKDPPGHGSPNGGEIHAWLANYEDDEPAAVERRWSGLTNSLGGLFCSSLNNLNNRTTTSPTTIFHPRDPQMKTQPLFHASLPLEHPCTENLTPFIDQLPCRAAAGLAQLLNPHKLFDANWQKLGVHIVRLPGERRDLQIVLDLEVVQDPVRMTRAAGSQPRREFSFESLFGRRITRACAVASQSRIFVDLQGEGPDSGVTVTPQPSTTPPVETNTITYQVSPESLPEKGLSLYLRWPVMHQEGFRYPSKFEPASITVHRINVGYGLERATVGIKVRNNRNVDATVRWLEEWPWWMKVYLHTMYVRIDGEQVPEEQVIRQLQYRPAKFHERPTVIEAELSLRVNSSTLIVMDVDKAYMLYQDYPPDANRGFDVPAGIVLVDPESQEERRRIYTDIALIDLPLPDFSMPYNVIIMTCTVMALFFGHVFNLLTRTWSIVDLRDEPAEGKQATQSEELEKEMTDEKQD